MPHRILGRSPMGRDSGGITSAGVISSRIPTVLLAHPFELALGAALIANSLRALGGDIAPSIRTLPDYLVVLYFLISSIGGVGLVVGILLREHRQNEGRQIGFCVALERASLFLVAASYTTTAIGVVTVNGTDGVGVAVVTIVVAAACVLRAMAIRRAARAILATLAHINREVGRVP